MIMACTIALLAMTVSMGSIGLVAVVDASCVTPQPGGVTVVEPVATGTVVVVDDTPPSG